MTDEATLMHDLHAKSFPVTVTYSLKFEALEFLSLAEALVAPLGAHPELIVHAQAYRCRFGGEVGALTGIAELDEVGLSRRRSRRTGRARGHELGPG